MIRFILVVIVLLSFLVLSIPLLIGKRLIEKKSLKRSQEHSLKVVQAMFRMIIRLTGSRVEVRGAENIPDCSVLYVANHSSYFDILVGYTTVPSLTGFVAKKEMLRYPLLADWMKNVNCLFLDRKDIKAGMRTILEGIEKVKAGISIWIFPEGTRNEHDNPEELLEFKEGSLKIAEKSGCPIVPVAISGTSDIFEKQLPFMRPSKVIIEYGEPFYIKELAKDKQKKAGAYTRGLIIEMLKKQQETQEV